MSLHADLLKQAHHLATKEPRRPSQASLRRAISASYYALFHRLVDGASRMMISRRDRDPLRQCLSRAFRHSDMRDLCRSLAGGTPPAKLEPAFNNQTIDRRLVDIARSFRDLQEARHQADYNTYRPFQRSEALHYHLLATQALQDWNAIRRNSQADAFLTGLLIIRHIQG